MVSLACLFFAIGVSCSAEVSKCISEFAEAVEIASRNRVRILRRNANCRRRGEEVKRKDADVEGQGVEEYSGEGNLSCMIKHQCSTWPKANDLNYPSVRKVVDAPVSQRFYLNCWRTVGNTGLNVEPMTQIRLREGGGDVKFSKGSEPCSIYSLE